LSQYGGPEAYPRRVQMDLYTSKLPKVDLTTDEEYVATHDFILGV